MRILYLDLDTLRPDHLGCYGYHRNTSPNIDAIAAKGVLFEQYYCSDAPCAPSRAALMSGRFGIHTGLVGHGGTGGEIRPEGASRGFGDRLCFESLPAMLRQAGIKPVTVSPFAERHGQWTFYAGFAEMHDTGKRGMESAEDVTPTALKWIENNAHEDNWMLHVNYWDPHTPYRAPEEFGNPFKDDPLPDWITPEVIEEHQQVVGPHCAREVSMFDNRENPNFPRHPGDIRNTDDARRMIDGYDCGIRYMDEHIGTLLKALKDKGVDLDDLAVIVSSDHAENLGELGIWGEHATADAITPHIPMIIKWPGCKVGHRDKGLHYQIDLPPTMAELLDREPKPRWDGQSYAPALLEGADCGRSELILSQCAHVCQRGVRFDDWMYVRTYHDGYHLFPTDMLFNIADDPHQQRNLAEERPDLVHKAAYLLENWHQEQMLCSELDADPLWTVIREGGPAHAKGNLPRYCRFLEESDRAWAIPRLKERHPYEFPEEQ